MVQKLFKVNCESLPSVVFCPNIKLFQSLNSDLIVIKIKKNKHTSIRLWT